MKRIIRKCRKVPATKALFRWIGSGLSQDFVPFPNRPGATAFLDFYSDCWMHYGQQNAAPRLYWSYQDSRATARVAGRSRDPVVAITAGLVSLFPHQSDALRVYLFHEFGHIVNRDLEVLGLTMSGSRACRSVIFSSFMLSSLFLLPLFSSDVWGALVLLVGAMWLLLLGFLWLFMARYAGIIISIRELYADVQAVRCLPGLGAYETVLGNRVNSWCARIWHNFRSLVSLRLIHLSPGERLAFLRRPGSLLFPRHRYYVFAGLLLITLQSNAFAEGFENNWMRWTFLLAWAPIGVAYLMNAGRAIEGCALLPEVSRVTRMTGLAFGITAVLFLPMLKIPGLYGDLVLSAGKWDSFKLGVEDTFRTLVVQWAHIEFLTVPVLSALWVVVNFRLARQCLRNTDTTIGQENLASRNRSFLTLCLLAVAIEAIVLAIREYGTESPSFLDKWQQALSFSRSLPQLLTMAVLVGGAFWVWRRTGRVRLRSDN